MNFSATVDRTKRITLKSIAGVGLVTSIPMLALASFDPLTLQPTSQDVDSNKTPSLKALYIHNPVASSDVLVILNLSDTAITIESFRANPLLIDRELIDCNDVCNGSDGITISAGEELKLRLSQGRSSRNLFLVGEYLQNSKEVCKRPNGVRLVSMHIQMAGNTAVLTAARTEFRAT